MCSYASPGRGTHMPTGSAGPPGVRAADTLAREEGHHLAFVRLLPATPPSAYLESSQSAAALGVPGVAGPTGAIYPDWLAACFRLTPRLEKVAADAALLDLGHCTDTEARVAVGGLLDQLRQAHATGAQADVAPSGVVAQLALQGPRDAHASHASHASHL